MHSNRGFYTRANKLAQEAVDADNEDRWLDAVNLYTRALEDYRLGLKYERVESTARLITAHVEAYITRVKDLEMLIEASPVERAVNRPLAMAHVTSEVALVLAKPEHLAETTWDDVIGLEKVKHVLHLAVIVPTQMPHLFTGNREPPRGLLLYGPPGVGKTHIARALANASGRNFFAVTSAQIISKYVGESERNVAALFVQIREQKPCIVFIDEIEALCTDREDESGNKTKAVNQFLIEMDGLSSDMRDVLLMGATNLPWKLDGGVLRRLNRKIYVPLPSIEDRYKLLAYYLAKNEDDVGEPVQESALWELAESLVNYSASEIANLVRTAHDENLGLLVTARFTEVDGKYVPSHEGSLSLAEVDMSRIQLPALTASQLRETCDSIKPSVNEEKLVKYEKWTQEYGEV